MPPPRSRGTAFVLAGGGSHGVVQVGMLRALVAAGVHADFVVGTSVGAINGTFFASDPSAAGVERLARIWTSIRRRDIYPVSPLGWVPALLGGRTHLLDPSGLRSVIARSLSVERLEDTRVPCAVIGARITDGAEVVITDGPAVDAVLGSASLPVLFPSVRVGDDHIVDGAVASNTAISAAIALGAERVIVLPTGFACAAKGPPRNAVATALHLVSILLARQLANDAERCRERAAIVVVPPLCPLPVSSYDFSQGAALLDRAAEATAQWIAAAGLDDTSVPLTLSPHAH